MSKLTVTLIVLVIFPIWLLEAEGRRLRFTNRQGDDVTIPIANDKVVMTLRDDESVEIAIGYENGALSGVRTSRSNGSVELLVVYEDGRPFRLYSYRPDNSLESIIEFANGYPVCK